MIARDEDLFLDFTIAEHNTLSVFQLLSSDAYFMLVHADVATMVYTGGPHDDTVILEHNLENVLQNHRIIAVINLY